MNINNNKLIKNHGIDTTCNYDIDNVIKQYNDKLKFYNSFEKILIKYIDQLLENAINEGKIKLDKNAIELKSRTKTIESFKGKISRDDKKSKYKDPINEVTDLVGIKILLTSLKDEHEVYELLKLELKDNIDWENSIDKTKDIKKQRKFGYLGRHLVISYNDKMLKLIGEEDDYDSKNFSNLKAEIQIKTLLQHVWAEVEHKARYKAGEELDDDKKRYFDRLAALIEVADDLFKDLIEETEKINKQSKKYIDKEQNELDTQEQIENEPKVLISSESMALYLENEKVKEKFKSLNKENVLYVLYNEEPSLISANFIELLKIINIYYTKDLNTLFDEQNKKILYKYAQSILDIDKSPSRLPKLSIMQILAYAKANEKQKEKIKEKKLIFDRTYRIIDKLIKGENND
ncbi:hypothetical protein IY974_04265 [Campylobacter volucris]|uniref:GTP pyrophosphokinase n=1 Tax=Campylobacter volucris TaxID=1031542 RepID=UPI0018A01422|nr:hypothetical protein [Campylobacter volucris]MBF7045777.1 hypothetical protein [Campylobacter volucris]